MLEGHRMPKPLPKELLNVYLAVASLVGITITKLSAEQLEQTNIRLQEMDRLKSVFLASMSHELRTPLNSIIGFTGIILQGMSGEVNEEQRKQLTVVKKNANHLLSLINDILDISRIEAGKVDLSLEEFGLDDVVREVVETVSPTAREKGLELLTEVPEGITLFTDRRRVKQVLVNLGGNAVKFTDQGSVKIAASVPGDDNLEVRVIDTGIGIKKEDMDKLFEPFQQVDISLTKKHEGTGLGLYLSKRLAALLGGDISAKSEYGRGSEFTFTLPLQYREEQK
jgi:signal transduction histidine kinase